MVKVKSFSIIEELIVEYGGAEYRLCTKEERGAFKNMVISTDNAEKLKEVKSDLHAHLAAILHLKCSFQQEKLL